MIRNAGFRADLALLGDAHAAWVLEREAEMAARWLPEIHPHAWHSREAFVKMGAVMASALTLAAALCSTASAAWAWQLPPTPPPPVRMQPVPPMPLPPGFMPVVPFHNPAPEFEPPPPHRGDVRAPAVICLPMTGGAWICA